MWHTKWRYSSVLWKIMLIFLVWFLSKKSRNISFENAIILQKNAKKLNINGVGVFVNKNIYELEEIINTLKLRFVQLHGSENDDI